MNITHEILPWANPGFRENPYPWYARLQRDYPVYQENEKSFIVSRYDDYITFVKHPAMSMVEPEWVQPHHWRAFLDTILFYDPPKHTALRRHTNKWFTPKLVREWVKHTTEVVREALGEIDEQGYIEAHHHLCVVPTHITMCRVLGIVEDDIELATLNTLKIVGMQTPASTQADRDRAKEGFDWLFSKCRAMIEEKKANPGEGLLDAMLALEAAGEMTSEEVLQTLVLFYFSGAPNPAYVLAAILENFARQPHLFDLYRDEPESRAAMINEFIRLNPPEQSFTRYPTEDVEIRGIKIPAGSSIRFMTAAVNRDESVFKRPNQFDHTRPQEASQHVSFGIGVHACAGQVISRAEIEASLNVIAEHYSRIELAEEPVTLNDDRIRNYITLPLFLKK
ncbi:cytochrome P450 [Pseudomonas coleopterorum]|uniref:cytochrome P450 n=1 Tax=Pseudomonas coleopterorum TaxID=1605838 RepID=UPI0017834520|nr:cytochrome P450 [Pseudomonas coleopterorum]MBD8480379.1 cytochrome P450 [Pseudomonas coleopterorum]